MTMRVLVVHSDVGADARPDDLDTLTSAEAVATALRARGHVAELAPFAASPDDVRQMLETFRADAVFNMVESVFGQDSLAAIAPSIFEKIGVPYTGNASAPIAVTGDKPLAKRLMRAAGLPTPDWAEPPSWDGLDDARTYIVKSATEDASLGLDDAALVRGLTAAIARADRSVRDHHGRWFAEAYVEGREFNVALLEEEGRMRALPIPEMRFEDWPAAKPRIVGYGAKWDEGSDDAVKTVRAFGLEAEAPALARTLSDLALETARLFGIQGYARVDFRTDRDGRPFILEVNANPCLDPHAGFAAAAAEAGLGYETLIGSLLAAARLRG
jgi:D-alanine-D-alanine ligase